ncbi:MAG: hypothetical protein OEV15_05755 [Gallionella sp.]|nr:hypothetical protein [Gallionella sp.]
MFIQCRKIIAILSAATLLGGGANIALAAEHNHSHESHASHAQEAPKLTLNNGKKWETDDNLRMAMSRIRDALSAELPAIHSGKATAAQYQALVQKTNDQIAFMVKNCKLEPKADAMLHLLLADIISGADAMAGKDIGNARKGAEKIAGALDNYPTYFAHPGWQGVKAEH